MVLVSTKNADDRLGIESSDSDTGRCKEKNEADILDEKGMIFAVLVRSIVRETGKHDVNDAVDGYDEHILNLGDELINTNDTVRRKKAEKNHICLGVHAGGNAGDEERFHRFEVAADVEFLPRSESDNTMKTNHVENVGPVSGENNNGPIDVIIISVMDEEEHENKTDEFDHETADSDVSVLFDSLVEPFNAETGKP